MSIISEQEQYLKKLQSNQIKFENIPIIYQLDEQIALHALKQDGTNLKYLSQKQQNDLRYVLEAIESNTDAYNYIGIQLSKDKRIIDLVLSCDCSLELLYEISCKNSNINEVMTKVYDKINITLTSSQSKLDYKNLEIYNDKFHFDLTIQNLIKSFIKKQRMK